MVKPCVIIAIKVYIGGTIRMKIKERLDKEATEYNRLDGLFKNITKNHPIRAHDYMIIESENFRGKILDVGSGPGILAIVAKLKNPDLDITCMDGSKIHTDIGKILANKCKVDIEFRHASLEEDAPYPPNSFDTIVLNHIMEHIEDLDMLFNWCENILRPGGTILIAVPYLAAHWSPNHVHFFDVKDEYQNTTNILEFLKKRRYKIDIRIFNEMIDPRHPHDSKGQLDMYMEVKV